MSALQDPSAVIQQEDAELLCRSRPAFFSLFLRVLPCFQFNRKIKCCPFFFFCYYFAPSLGGGGCAMPDLISSLSFPPAGPRGQIPAGGGEVRKAATSVRHVLCLVQRPSSPSASSTRWLTQALRTQGKSGCDSSSI